MCVYIYMDNYNFKTEKFELIDDCIRLGKFLHQKVMSAIKLFLCI